MDKLVPDIVKYSIVILAIEAGFPILTLYQIVSWETLFYLILIHMMQAPC